MLPNGLPGNKVNASMLLKRKIRDLIENLKPKIHKKIFFTACKLRFKNIYVWFNLYSEIKIWRRIHTKQEQHMREILCKFPIKGNFIWMYLFLCWYYRKYVGKMHKTNTYSSWFLCILNLSLIESFKIHHYNCAFMV